MLIEFRVKISLALMSGDKTNNGIPIMETNHFYLVAWLTMTGVAKDAIFTLGLMMTVVTQSTVILFWEIKSWNTSHVQISSLSHLCRRDSRFPPLWHVDLEDTWDLGSHVSHLSWCSWQSRHDRSTRDTWPLCTPHRVSGKGSALTSGRRSLKHLVCIEWQYALKWLLP